MLCKKHQRELTKIWKIDKNAAIYIKDKVIPSYAGRMNKKHDILDHFVWSNTPQGRYHWFLIWTKINLNEKN